jgi:integrase
VCIYAYAWKGGELLCRGEGRDLASAREALECELGRRDTLARLEHLRKPDIKPEQSKRFVKGLVTAFLASPEYEKLSKSTQTAYRGYLDRFREEFGDWKVSLFEQAGVVADLVDWRDDWADRPRAADYAMQSVARLFSWARRRGLTSADPTKDIERLHRADRSDIIWTDADMVKFCAKASPELQWAVRLAALTGLRQGDLLRLTWTQVAEWSVVTKTAKRKKLVTVPLLPATQALLREIPKRGPMVLTNTYGKPWTTDGFKSSFGKVKKDAGLALRFHDLRGTAATRFKLEGLDNDDIGRVFGWSEDHVEALMARYVSGDALALDMLSRMKQKRPLTNQRQTGE